MSINLHSNIYFNTIAFPIPEQIPETIKSESCLKNNAPLNMTSGHLKIVTACEYLQSFVRTH